MSNILTDLTARQAKAYAGREAFRYQDAGGCWVSCSWSQFDHDVNCLSFAFETLGIEPQDMIGVFSANCPEILVTDFACFRNRAVPVAIYATSSADQVAYILADAGARMIMVGNQAQYAIAREVASRCARLERIVVYDAAVELDADDNTTMTFESLLIMGEAASAMCRRSVAERAAAARPDDIATLLYTSGTTGEPKGAVLPHSCFTAALETHMSYLTTLSIDDTSLCFLPLSHIFEKAWTYFCLAYPMRVAINRDPHAIQQTIREVRPTCMCSVPRFWEKVYTAIQEKLAHASKLKRRMALAAIATGSKRNLQYARYGRKAPLWLEMRYRFFDKKVLSVMRRAIGIDNGNLFPTAGAPLSENIVEFFHSIGLNIVVGYGLSETTATVTCFPQRGYKIGTVGKPLPVVDVKIGNNNEILVKGPTIMRGYYNRPDATAAAFTSDGWFRTGDAGYFDESGALVLTERIKDLFKTSNGKYIAPQAIESRLGEDRYIEQVAVIGDRRKYVTAIIVPALEALKEYAERHNIRFRSIDELVENSEIRRFIEQRIERLQNGLAGFEKIKRFTLLPREFTIESGELTNTLKIRRPVINRNYASQIEAMYC